MSNQINEIYGLITDKSFCDRAIDFYNLKQKENVTECGFENFYGKTLDNTEITDDKLRKQIKSLVYRITQEFYNRYKISIYPSHWDITYWAPGSMFEAHVDNLGSPGNPYDRGIGIPSINSRNYTSVCYLNDDYIGGETFLGSITNPDYTCKPEKEKIFIFPSGYPHGVTNVESGDRYVLLIWFTEDENFLMEYCSLLNSLIEEKVFLTLNNMRSILVNAGKQNLKNYLMGIKSNE